MNEVKTVGQFLDLVKEMRMAQKKAAKTFLAKDISYSQRLEREVDRLLNEREKKKTMANMPKQPELFG